MMVQNKVRT